MKCVDVDDIMINIIMITFVVITITITIDRPSTCLMYTIGTFGPVCVLSTD